MPKGVKKRPMEPNFGSQVLQIVTTDAGVWTTQSNN